MNRSLIVSIAGAMLLTSASFAFSQPFTGPDGRTIHQSKCSHSPQKCYNDASATCRGPYQILSSESRAGGLFADIFPGPVTWYNFSYSCGESDGQMATFPHRGVAPQMPQMPVYSPPRITTCSSNRIGNTLYTNCR